jgi:hypothetical protein
VGSLRRFVVHFRHDPRLSRGKSILLAPCDYPENVRQAALDGNLDAGLKSLTGSTRQPNDTTETTHAVQRDVQTDTSAGEKIGGLAGRKSREKQEREKRIVVGGFGDRRGDGADLDCTLTNGGYVDASAVIFDRNA